MNTNTVGTTGITPVEIEVAKSKKQESCGFGHKRSKFIYTKSQEMANELTLRGFPFICKSGDFFVFENKNLMNFSFAESSRDVILSNKLTFQGGF